MKADKLSSSLHHHSSGLYIVFQPQIDITSGKTIGAEALCRWHHPRIGLIPPSFFIPMLDARGHSSTLFFLILDACLDMNQKLSSIGIQLQFSINASPLLFLDDRWIERLQNTVTERVVHPKHITLEMLESGSVNDTSALRRSVQYLITEGYNVAIDDFGTGSSNDILLADIPFNKLKLDRSFVASIDKDDRYATICRHQIELAKSLNIECIAEGVETIAQKRALLEGGCTIGQGYLWAPPIPSSFFFNEMAWMPKLHINGYQGVRHDLVQ